MIPVLIALAVIFSELSLMAFGGGITILPEMQRQVVEVHQWMSAQEFSALFAMAQAAPGPNMMVVPLIGWHVAGWAGLLVSSLAKFVPSSLVTLLVMQVWKRFKDRPWRRYVQAGLVPVTVGLVAASGALIAEASASNWRLALLIGVATLLSMHKRLHPLWVLAGGALLGLLIA
ncbi:chromate transporter [Serratia rhizosphaerae]|uniref:chromate transporter n=1 Tax=unclassified Serratia (in: enterobacteria) TaxID=2647522 RepID=UPI000CF68F18|nr:MULTISPECIES: chromate transporter [unclassified Serratia (in: enterobacteria)]AVJ17681.1 chromate transporter [Serratia sp. MYb239]QPT11308.1 chromate transporter [Serratia rubidaea]CAE1145929.1 Chromate transport protein ChrA [Serratia sp. Tan611]SQJ19943.1 chromate transporter, chromate ion transporter (CHR) family [Serratia rubidaea]